MRSQHDTVRIARAATAPATSSREELMAMPLDELKALGLSLHDIVVGIQSTDDPLTEVEQANYERLLNESNLVDKVVKERRAAAITVSFTFDHSSDGTWTCGEEALDVRACGDTLAVALKAAAGKAAERLQAWADHGTLHEMMSARATRRQ